MLFTEAQQAFTDYLIIREKSKETIRGYTHALSIFNRYLEEQLNGLVYIDEITVEHMERYLEWRKSEGVASASRSRLLYIFRSFFNFCHKKDLLHKNPSLKLEPIKVQQKERPHLTPTEVDQLLSVITRPLIHTVVFTLAYTGLRVSELCHLTIDDVNLDKGLLQVIEGKGKKNRTIPISDKLNDKLAHYLTHIRPEVPTDRFFATQKTGKLSQQSVNFYIKEATAKLGWEKPISAHTMRHSFASNLVRSNAPLPTIQSLLGHSDLRVTSRYLHQNIDELKDAVNLL